MVFPPSPESPAVRFHRGNPASLSTPRVGMLVSSSYVSNEEDDDVSVLTSHTLGTKDTLTSSPSVGSPNEISSVKSDDVDKNKVYRGGESCIKQSLSHISEESQNSSEYRTPKKDVYNEKEDDESLSLAESVLDNATRVLSSIGSSSYYSGMSTKSKPTPTKMLETFSPPPQPNGKHPFPVKLSGVNVFSAKSFPEKSTIREMQGKVLSVGNMYTTNVTRCAPLESSEKSNRSSNFNRRPTQYSSPYYNNLSSDEPNENSIQPNLYSSTYYKKAESGKGATLQEKTSHDNTNDQTNFSTYSSAYYKMAAASTTRKGDELRRIQAETKQLQLLLREKQLETKLAMSELDASIRKANELLLD